MSKLDDKAAYERWAKPELVAEIARLLRERRETEELRRSLFELETYQEEVRMQQTELREARSAIEDARDRYEQLYDFAPFAYLTLDAHGVISQINHGGCKLLGDERAHAVNRPLVLYVVEADRQRFFRHMRACRAKCETVRTELRINTRDRRIVAVELYSRVSRLPAGDVGKEGTFLTAITDLTDRRRAEDEHNELRVREQVAKAMSEAKDRLLAVVSHELRTPLAPILSGAELLASSALPSGLRGAAETIRRNVEIEARLVDDLLEFTRARSGKLRLELRSIDVDDLIREVVETFQGEAQRRRVALRTQLDAIGSGIHADAVRVRQILSNLIRNALAYTQPYGSITVYSSDRRDGVIIGVRDTGAGIAAADLARIFDPFEQARAQPTGQGLGLGLAIAKDLVEAHGGTISVASEGKGYGSCFEVTLPRGPAVEAPHASSPAVAGASNHDPAGVRILIVEDHVDAATSLSELLQAKGYRTSVAFSFEAALEAARDDFDVLISDISLPDGSGLDLIRSLQERGPVKGIALSGFGSQEDVERSRSAGFHLHLTKPADAGRIIEAINSVAPLSPPRAARRA